MYETNANSFRSFRSQSAQAVARVAATWRRQGHQPKAYAVVGDPVKVTEVPVTTARETAKALAAAR